MWDKRVSCIVEEQPPSFRLNNLKMLWLTWMKLFVCCLKTRYCKISLINNSQNNENLKILRFLSYLCCVDLCVFWSVCKKTRMTTFIKTKFKISDDQTNIHKYRLAGYITEFSRGVDCTQHWPPFSLITIAEWCCIGAEYVLRSGRTHLVGSQLLSVA